MRLQTNRVDDARLPYVFCAANCSCPSIPPFYDELNFDITGCCPFCLSEVRS